MGRKLPDQLKNSLLTLKPEDLTFTKLVSLLADRARRENNKVTIVKSEYNTDDEFDLDANEYINTTKVTTNVGLFIYNKFIVEGRLEHVLGYVNSVVDGKGIGKIEGVLSKALLEDKIDPARMREYIDRTQFLAMKIHSMLAGSFTMNTLKPNPKVIARRDQLIKENKEALASGDVITAVRIEKDLVKYASDIIGNDPGLDLYRSGARGSFDNNFKNMSIMKGPVFNPSTGRFDIVESNLMEGIRKEEIPIYANSIITGAYPKAIGTAKSGYFSKQIIAALQAVSLDQSNGDCGTRRTMATEITSSNSGDYMYRYIEDGNTKVMLDDSTMSKFIGKTVKLRTPMYCVNINGKICKYCAGEMYNKLGIENIGLTAARVASSMLNLSMKKFHNSTAKIYDIDPRKIVITARWAA